MFLFVPKRKRRAVNDHESAFVAALKTSAPSRSRRRRVKRREESVVCFCEHVLSREGSRDKMREVRGFVTW